MRQRFFFCVSLLALAFTLLGTLLSSPAAEARTTHHAHATPTATTVPSVTTWTTVLDDEFNDSVVNTTTWYTCPQVCTTTNNELEGYLASNVSEHDGYLDLTATAQPVAGYTYTSGKVMSNTSWTYGYFEARMLIPSGWGFWPAFWLLHSGTQNNSNELDIMEAVDPGTSFSDANIDWVSDHVNVGRRFLTFDGQAPADPAQWHIYGLDWEPGSLTYYLDGQAIFSVTNKTDVPQNSAFMILNLAVGGDWPGSPTSSTVFPAHVLVDWVHVLQH